MAPPRTPKLVLAACVLFLAVGCGVQAPENGVAVLSAGGSQGSATPAGNELKFGGEHRFASGVTITVSTPKSFQPSAGAYPRSPRAAAFDITIENTGADAYHLSGLSVTATVAGVPAKQVVDATQGFNGIFDAGKDVAPARSVHVTLAFAVPSEQVALRVQLRPTPSDPVAATYCGPA
ncbi:hypothetical protein [Amycolatopsis sp. H20-H5]|uniref:hypothetical protein n=1 Tax=Amycolatopsis sp. H20-H5 TaxID=3046309 RepID=UPI002DBE66AD|nr:hypothetical protein [Amycolatopsis sp. H20-H5]MEC3982344.1 hypothetical protein [Amycolatopsis sp. H20-H5]